MDKSATLIILFRPERIVERKSALFSIVVTGVVAFLALPVIIPHLLHGHHIAHIFLHVEELLAAISILAGFAYYRLRTKRLLPSAIAFANLLQLLLLAMQHGQIFTI